MMINSYFRKIEERKLPFPSSFPSRGDWREDNKLLVFTLLLHTLSVGNENWLHNRKESRENISLHFATQMSGISFD